MLGKRRLNKANQAIEKNQEEVVLRALYELRNSPLADRNNSVMVAQLSQHLSPTYRPELDETLGRLKRKELIHYVTHRAVRGDLIRLRLTTAGVQRCLQPS